MIINEDYFKDLEIEDEDIIEDDVEEPVHKLTLEEAKELPEQYNHGMSIKIRKGDSDRTFFQTSLLPRLFKRLDTIFEMYGIEHSEYILTSLNALEYCKTSFEFGNYQIFSDRWENAETYMNNSRDYIYFDVYLNYPKFNYKKAFRFVYSILNIFKIGKHNINHICFYLTTENFTDDINLYFNYKKYVYFYELSCAYGGHWTDDEIKLSNTRMKPENKERFYKCIIHHFLGKKEVDKIDYKAIDKYIPFKHFRL